MRLPEKKKERIDTFLREVNQRVLRVPSTTKTEVKKWKAPERSSVWGSETGPPLLQRGWGAKELIFAARRLN